MGCPMTRASLIALALLAGALPARVSAEHRFHEPVVPPRAVQVIAHRGLRSQAPDNSIEAVRECAVDFVEWAAIDVRTTRDGHLVVLHEEAFADVGMPGDARVADFTLDQIRGFESGAAFAPRYRDVRPVTLSQMFNAVGRDVNLVLNCDAVEPAVLVREIREADMLSHVAVAGSAGFLQQVRGVAGNDVALVAEFRPQQLAVEELLAQFRPAAVTLAVQDVTTNLCRELHACGVRIHAAAVGRTTDCLPMWTRLLECGVDAIVTDNPAGVRFCEVRRRIPDFPVQIACHRGANRYAPENTIPALRRAAEIGADYIEIDIRTTSDGGLVLLHDRTLDRTTSGTGPVNEQTVSAVAVLDAGSWFGAPFAGLAVPTFAEGLAALGDRAHAYLDAKDIAPEALVAAIRAHKLESRHVVYQSIDYGRRLKALDPDIRLLPPLKTPDDLATVVELSPFGVDAGWSILSAELIDRCHRLGIRVFSDALGPHETLADYRRAIDWGVDVIQTDYPLRVLRAIELQAAGQSPE